MSDETFDEADTDVKEEKLSAKPNRQSDGSKHERKSERTQAGKPVMRENRKGMRPGKPHRENEDENKLDTEFETNNVQKNEMKTVKQTES